MKHAPPPTTIAPHLVVRAINFELAPHLESAAMGKATGLLRHHAKIEDICIELENDGERPADQQFIAKGKVDFGGPALLASVTGRDAAAALDNLIDQLDHQLRRQRLLLRTAPRGAAGRTRET